MFLNSLEWFYDQWLLVRFFNNRQVLSYGKSLVLMVGNLRAGNLLPKIYQRGTDGWVYTREFNCIKHSGEFLYNSVN